MKTIQNQFGVNRTQSIIMLIAMSFVALLIITTITMSFINGIKAF